MFIFVCLTVCLYREEKTLKKQGKGTGNSNSYEHESKVCLLYAQESGEEYVYAMPFV
jgi:hypothetical protein